ncbi:MAG: putative thioredoxin [Chloroflexi bacterium]|nr:MAG: putative thioredoxin [Chloroflexota bacterium]
MNYEVNDFETDVLERSHTLPVLVDFWADWCGPCRVLGPVLEKLAGESDGRWELAKLDTERFQSVAAEYGIRSIPNVKLFVDGKVQDEFVGALPEPKVAEWLSKALPSKHAGQLETALALLGEGKTVEAQELLDGILAADPGQAQAAVLLAQTYFSTDPQRAAETVKGLTAGEDGFELAEAIRTLVALFVRAEDAEALPTEPAKDLYLAAIGEARSNSFEAALTGFIDVIRKNRSYDNDGARKASLAIFKLLGDNHPTTKQFRPALSNALF